MPGRPRTILAFDTALNNCSAAVFANGKSFSESKAMATGHAEVLMPMIERVLEKADIGYEEIEAIAVTVGPGAFTGLRIALSAARALGLSLQLPVYGITTTQILALQAVRKKPEPVAVILDTKRQDFYFQMFDAKGKAANKAESLPGDAVRAALKGDALLIGDGVERFNGEQSKIIFPDTALMAELLTTNPEFFTEGAGPVYLRGADVTASKRTQRTIEAPAGLK